MQRALLAVLVAAAIASATGAQASLALNGTGVSDGFSLSTVIGPYAYANLNDYTFGSIGVNASGQLVAPTSATGDTYVFPDVDNQTIANGTLVGTIGSGFAMAQIGSSLYGSKSFGNFYNFNANGTIGAQIVTSPSVNSVYGLWGDPVSGKLLASSSAGLVEINPGNGAMTLVSTVFNDGLDGVTVSPDGQTAYVADFSGLYADHVLGYSLAIGNFGTQVFDSGYLGHGSDGMGVLAGTCRQAGDIVVNNNDGTVGLIDPSSTGETVIASGGTRGDYTSADPTNGTLFLSQTDQIARLQAPAGCSLGTVVADVTEPNPLLLLLTTLPGFALLRRRRGAAGRTA